MTNSRLPQHCCCTVLCSTGLPPANPNVSLKLGESNEPVQVVIDTGSTGSFISASTAANFGLKVLANRKVTALANGVSLVSSATAQAKFEVNKKPTKLPSLLQNTSLPMIFSDMTFSDNISQSDWR